jgi:hypothetical protein
MFIPEGQIPLLWAVEVIAAAVDSASMGVPKPDSVLRAENLHPFASSDCLFGAINQPPTRAPELADWKPNGSNMCNRGGHTKSPSNTRNGWEHATAQRSDGTHIELRPWQIGSSSERRITEKGLFAEEFTEEPSGESWRVFLPTSVIEMS